MYLNYCHLCLHAKISSVCQTTSLLDVGLMNDGMREAIKALGTKTDGVTYRLDVQKTKT